MRRRVHTIFRLLTSVLLLTLLLSQCKKAEDAAVAPTPTPPVQETIKPRENVGYGATLLP